MKTVKPISEMYLGNRLGNGQDPDVRSEQDYSNALTKISGRGSTSGGSKPTNKANTTGSGTRSAKITLKGSGPRNPQRLRG